VGTYSGSPCLHPLATPTTAKYWISRPCLLAMLHIPTTPTSTHSTFRLPSSSPLQFEPPSSPLAGPSASARRASQYKSRTSARRTLFPAGGDQTTPTAPRASVFEGGRRSEPAQSTLLRERFRVRCEERAARARAEGVRRSRYASSEAGSSDVDMAEDDDEDEEAFMADEVVVLLHTVCPTVLTGCIALPPHYGEQVQPRGPQLPSVIPAGGRLVSGP
jgi:hypothetical protein